MTIVYALVARQKTVLAEHTNTSGESAPSAADPPPQTREDRPLLQSRENLFFLGEPYWANTNPQK